MTVEVERRVKETKRSGPFGLRKKIRRYRNIHILDYRNDIREEKNGLKATQDRPTSVQLNPDSPTQSGYERIHRILRATSEDTVRVTNWGENKGSALVELNSIDLEGPNINGANLIVQLEGKANPNLEVIEKVIWRETKPKDYPEIKPLVA